MSLVSCDGGKTFSDDEAAEIMNSKFINIKVDVRKGLMLMNFI